MLARSHIIRHSELASALGHISAARMSPPAGATRPAAPISDLGAIALDLTGPAVSFVTQRLLLGRLETIEPADETDTSDLFFDVVETFARLPDLATTIQPRLDALKERAARRRWTAERGRDEDVSD
jgi:hypothetical protein